MRAHIHTDSPNKKRIRQESLHSLLTGSRAHVYPYHPMDGGRKKKSSSLFVRGETDMSGRECECKWRLSISLFFPVLQFKSSNSTHRTGERTKRRTLCVCVCITWNILCVESQKGEKSERCAGCRLPHDGMDRSKLFTNTPSELCTACSKICCLFRTPTTHPHTQRKRLLESMMMMGTRSSWHQVFWDKNAGLCVRTFGAWYHRTKTDLYSSVPAFIVPVNQMKRTRKAVSRFTGLMHRCNTSETSTRLIRIGVKDRMHTYLNVARWHES